MTSGTKQVRNRIRANRFAIVSLCLIGTLVFILPQSPPPKPDANVGGEEKGRHAYSSIIQKTFQNPLLQQERLLGFENKCASGETQTYEISNRKVKWSSQNFTHPFQNRGNSIHCFLARIAANYLPNNFSTTVRLDTGDLANGQRLTLFSATKDDSHHGTNNHLTSVLLFPDFTFTSWPEVGDFDIPAAVESTKQAAIHYGMPGTTKWLRSRGQLAVWRGNVDADPGYRGRYAQLSETYPKLFDIGGISYGPADPSTGLEMKATNRLTREDHCQYQFLVHLNGLGGYRYSSALKWKFLCASLVFVHHDGNASNGNAPNTPLFREWWNPVEMMQPYKHFVPFTTPEDLKNKVEYYKKNLSEAQEIAMAGYELALTAFESVEVYARDFLLEYAKLVGGLNQSICGASAEQQKQRQEQPELYKSFSDLQQEYGANVCR